MALYRNIIISYFVLNICFCSTVFAADTEQYWCGKTPHPVQCQSLLTPNPNRRVRIKTETEFVKISVQLTLDRAMQAKTETYSHGTKYCRNERQKSAWEDCLGLYEQMIHRLNQTVICPTGGCSDSDIKTWLSASLTSLDTCRLGFRELGVSDDFLPSTFKKVSTLISNALAINKATHKPLDHHEGVFLARLNAGAGKLLETPSLAQRMDVVVTKDGSGDFTTIQEAVTAALRRKGSRRYVIYVKEGIYEEYIEIGSKLTNVMMVGDGIGKTIITGDRSYGRGYSTFKSATFVALGDGFMARDITFRNTAGPENSQAVALRSDSDKSVFYKCSFEGYQDTLYVHSGRQFFRQCDIYGTVDFIFGNAAAIFQNCRILARNPPNRVNTITAQGRFNPNQTTGIIIQNSVVTAAQDLKSISGSGAGSGPGSVKTYLGRPWRPYARTVVMKTYLDGLIDPKGWLSWGNDSVLRTLYYGEYMNSGPGSGTENRVKWPGFHAIADSAEASKFTLDNFIDGGSWLPSENIPFATGYGL